MLFRQAGYYTCIGGFGASGKRLGKTDYNFEWPKEMYDSNDWAGRKPDQPFFMQVQLAGGKQAAAVSGVIEDAGDAERQMGQVAPVLLRDQPRYALLGTGAGIDQAGH